MLSTVRNVLESVRTDSLKRFTGIANALRRQLSLHLPTIAAERAMLYMQLAEITDTIFSSH